MSVNRPKRKEMVATIRQTVKQVERVEQVAFLQAAGRVCAADVFSRNTLPNTPVSRLDGVGVHYRDFACGLPDTSQWKEGREYVYCNTGIAIPDGFDTVIAIEHVSIGPDGVTFLTGPAERGELVQPVGYHMRQGERLIARGEQIVPAHVGLLAAGGVSQVPVYARPTVAVIPTGDELVAPTAAVPQGKNVDSNSYMIGAYLEQWGALPTLLPLVRDDPDLLRRTVSDAVAAHDAVIVIAGSSLGTRDYTIRILRELGEVVVQELAHGPGRKSSLSVVGGKPVLGIAGPPLGAQIACDLYLAPFVSALRGLPYVEMRTLEVISDDPFPPRQADFCERVHIYRGPDGFHIRSAFAPTTTRAQMQALSNGNFYREAGTGCQPGGTTTVELLCPIEAIPERDRLPEILKGGKEEQI